MHRFFDGQRAAIRLQLDIFAREVMYRNAPSYLESASVINKMDIIRYDTVKPGRRYMTRSALLCWCGAGRAEGALLLYDSVCV